MVRPEIKKKRRELVIARNQSRKKIKKLEKVVLHKKNKINRGKLLAELKQCQLQPNQLELLHSTSSMQTKGLKRFVNDDTETNLKPRLNDIDRAEQCLDASLLLRRKRRKRTTTISAKVSSSSEDTDDISTDTEIYDCDKTNEPERLSTPPIVVVESKPTKPQPTPFRALGQQRPPPSRVTNIKSEDRKDNIPSKAQSQPAVNVPVSRDPVIEKSRLQLPIIGEEQSIIESIRYNDVVIVSGETGSGKTTQIPQFLYEAGYALNGAMIGITEPRRVAAVSMSERVAQELNLTSNEVSYQIRFSGNVTSKTRIKFMTDGVLMRECQQDFLLSKYSVIIIDEAHERSVFSDILIGLISRIVPMRRKRQNPLKLVIMSATLRVDDFVKNSFLFKIPPPIINIETRQFPVTVQFAKETPSDYLQAAYRKVCSIHSKMPKGGILVFVTSQNEVKDLCRKLNRKFSPNECSRSRDELPDSLHSSDADSGDDGTMAQSNSPLFCLGLYAMLSMEKQKLVFKEPSEGSRLCVIATNVAETSITIPNIRYVVDTGMEKIKVYDLVTGVSKFITTWTSKSSAEQRMGRAGRMGPGICYRLYSSAVFVNELPEHALPRILQKPVEDVLLQMKSMNIDNVVNFPFPTRPSIESLMAAEKTLIILGALNDISQKHNHSDQMSKADFSSKITPLGKKMAKLAVGARCAKMIVKSPPDLLPHVISLVSAISVREMFIAGDNWREIKKKWAGHGKSKLLGDFVVMLKAVLLLDSTREKTLLDSKCKENGLQSKAILEIHKLRKHLAKEINREKFHKKKKLKHLSNSQYDTLRKLLLSSYCDHVAKKLPDGFIEEESSSEPGQFVKKKLKNAYESMETRDPVYIGSESVLKGKHPEYVIYKELYQGDKKTYMRDVAVVEPSWLHIKAPKLCSFKESNHPLHNQSKSNNLATCKRLAYYGPHNWPLGLVDTPRV